MELNRTLFIKASAPGSLALWSVFIWGVRECACACVVRVSQEKKKGIEQPHAQAAKFLIGN